MVSIRFIESQVKSVRLLGSGGGTWRVIEISDLRQKRVKRRVKNDIAISEEITRDIGGET